MIANMQEVPFEQVQKNESNDHRSLYEIAMLIAEMIDIPVAMIASTIDQSIVAAAFNGPRPIGFDADMRILAKVSARRDRFFEAGPTELKVLSNQVSSFKGKSIEFFATLPICNRAGQVIAHLILLSDTPSHLNGARRKSLSRFTFLIESIFEQTALVESIKKSDAFAQSKLELTMRQLASVIEVSPAGIIFFDADMTIRIWNAGCEKMYGWTKEECIGVNLRTQGSPESIATINILEQLKANSDRIEVCEDKYCKDGKHIKVKASVVPLIDNSGLLLGYLSVMVDISDLISRQDALTKANQTLKEATEAKSRFLATVSHELRTPLNSVLGMSEFLLDSDLEDEQKQFIQSIFNSGERLLKIVDRILDITNPQKILKSSISELDADQLLIETKLLHKDAAEKKKLSIVFEPCSGFKSLQGNRPYLQKALNILVENAIAYTKSGFVRIRAERIEQVDHANGMMKFIVEDSGVGISPEDILKIFDLFEQKDISVKKDHEGFGLGLAAAQSIVKSMGGTLGVTSELGKGSLFWFTIGSIENA